MRKALMLLIFIFLLAMPAICGCGDLMESAKEVKHLEMVLDNKKEQLLCYQQAIIILPEELQKHKKLTAELQKLQKEKRELEQRIKSGGK